MADKDYLGLVGCLAYLANTSRPDIVFHTSYLGQYMSKPSVACYNAALDVLSYCHKTKKAAITYGGRLRLSTEPTEPPLGHEVLESNGLVAYSDASYGSVKSHGGHMIMYGNAAVAWTSRRLKVIALSSAEAEICAGVGASKDIIFLRQLLREIGLPCKGPTPLVIDNEAMYENVRNPGVSGRTRHFELWLQFCRAQVQRGNVKVHLTPSESEYADLFTKPLPKEDVKARTTNLYKMFRDFTMNIV